VQWQDKVMTGQRPVTKTRMVQREVCENVSRCVQEPFTYTVMERFCVPEKRMTTVCENVLVDVPFTYTVCEPVTTQVKRTVTEYQQNQRQVPYTYTVCTPTTVQ